jgi:hypothetical protein
MVGYGKEKFFENRKNGKCGNPARDSVGLAKP